MSLDSIIYVPERPTKNAGVKIQYHNRARIDPVTGERLQGGNGCHYWDNCFDCPFPPDRCFYDAANQRSFSMKKMRINAISDKQKIEIQRRRVLKDLLITENGNHCMTCKDGHRDFRGISLSHIIPLSRGGKTTRENCLLECGICHDKYEKHPELREPAELIRQLWIK